jgi:hypothetical protein
MHSMREEVIQSAVRGQKKRRLSVAHRVTTPTTPGNDGTSASLSMVPEAA